MKRNKSTTLILLLIPIVLAWGIAHAYAQNPARPSWTHDCTGRMDEVDSILNRMGYARSDYAKVTVVEGVYCVWYAK
jgi:hypothetical protein